jgi:hypothetical protein
MSLRDDIEEIVVKNLFETEEGGDVVVDTAKAIMALLFARSEPVCWRCEDPDRYIQHHGYELKEPVHAFIDGANWGGRQVRRLTIHPIDWGEES